MRKEHKYKHARELDVDVDLARCSGEEDSSTEYKECLRRKQKHKRHKYKDDDEEYFDSKYEMDEGSLALSDKIIQIHGSSSEDENGNSESEQRIFSKHTDEKISSDDKYDSSRKEERKYKKEHRNKNESPFHSDSVSKKQRHHSYYKKAQNHKRKFSDSDSEENVGAHHKQHKNRDSSSDNSKKEEKKIKGSRKVNTELNDSVGVKKENCAKQGKAKRIKTEAKSDQNNGRSEPSGSRNGAVRERRGSKDREVHEWGGVSNKSKPSKVRVEEVQKPNFDLSGKLVEDTNTYNGVVIKYSEPPEARMPKKRWRLYPFKGDQGLPTLYIHRQSAYLLGRDRKVADIPIDHPSCSKQHAALQYRLVSYQRPNGTLGKQIRLYIIDLESANGTFINNNKIQAKKYVELFEKDVIKFGFSSREYVLLHEHSKDEDNSEDDS